MILMDPPATDADPNAAPGPGVYPDCAADAYHAWPLPSNSLLTHVARSPLHARHAMDFPTEPTADMQFGTAFHARILEPAKFADQFVRASCEAVTGKGARCGNPAKVRNGNQFLCGKHGTLSRPDAGSPALLSEDDDFALAVMHRAVLAHPWAGPTLALPGDTELSIVFDDPITSVRCKMRADRIVTDRRRRCVVDLKTTRDASPADFAKTIHTRGYHRQAAMYLRGCAAAGIDVDGFVIVAVEKEPPYAVAAYQLDDEDLAAGSAELDRLLTTYAECERADRWPGYGDGLTPIRLPAWARRRDETKTDAT